jgi:uncharacterized protein
VLEFDWDVENLTHIARHHVASEDVEFALTNGSVEIEYQDWHSSEVRFAEVGITASGRILYILITMRGHRIRVVTAYDAPRDLVREYLERG